ncbi:VWA domain-containing protein [Alsobacter sp. R-9]
MANDTRKDVTRTGAAGGASTPAPVSDRGAIDAFIATTKALAPGAAGQRGRLVFALDATMSRQPTWDLACRQQAQMFEAAASVGGLDVQLCFFRGFAECRASRWVSDARGLTDLMTQISCRGGHTQIRRVLEHVRDETRRTPVRALVFVGDAMEEKLDDVCAVAGELRLLGVKAFMFQEGRDGAADTAFREVARITGGAYARFGAGAGAELAALLRAAAAYAAGGRASLEALARRDGAGAQALLGQIS